MVVLREVDVWPPGGFTNVMVGSAGWPEDHTPIEDAFIRSAWPVAGLWRAALADIRLPALRSAPRVFVSAGWPPEAPMKATVDVIQFWKGLFRVTFPVAAGGLDAVGRADLIARCFEVALTQVLLDEDDAPLLTAAGQAMEEQRFVFRWASVWKRSPNRRFRARCEFVQEPVDGLARARLCIEGPDGRSESPPAVAPSHVWAMKRATAELRWQGSDVVGSPVWLAHRNAYEDPYTDVRVSARAVDGRWAFAVENDPMVRQPAGPGLDDMPVVEPSDFEIVYTEGT